MALSYATVVRNFIAGDSSAIEMAIANTGEPDTDALAWYAGVFADRGMNNSENGLDTLRHLYVLLMGLGMRESSGQHCCGMDRSADNYEHDTCEAGAWQMSWNMVSSSPEMQKLLDQFSSHHPCPQGLLQYFEKGVSCSGDDWECYGSKGEPGLAYQELAKVCPQFAAETAAVGLRKRRQHWGPINRLEAEVRPEANDLFQAVQDLVQTLPIA
jgi:hypothetical protein